MKRPKFVAVMAATVALATLAWGEMIDPNLEALLANTADQATVSTLVYLSQQVDLEALAAQFVRGQTTRQARHALVVRSLQQQAASTQDGLLGRLAALQAAGAVAAYEPFWIANCVRVDGTPAAIREIAARPDVYAVYLNYPIETIAPVSPPTPDARPPQDNSLRDDPEIGLVAIRAPEVWAMGITGDGVLVATLDTGVDGNHPALASRWRGVADPRYQGHPQWAWFDPVTFTTFPMSFGAHGTHTMGTVCGGAPGDSIGVAPGAQWMHAAVIDRVNIPTTVADAIEAFQWMLDPDENPDTDWDVPGVCSNSWRVTTWHGYPPCDQTFWVYLDACEAAGIVILFSAGNEGPSPETIGRPPDRATTEYNVCAVGAVNANVPTWPIADFSSRGPSHCTPGGEAAIKPEVVAPGVDVRSSVPGGGYEQWGWSGTSMASPHVNGTVALMLEACPDLEVEQIKQILYDTAVDLGTAGNDNAYGYGMIDAYEAVLAALDACGPHPPRVYDGWATTVANTPVTIELEARDDGLPEPPQMNFIIDTLPSHGILSDPGAGRIESVPYVLVGGGNQVIYRPSPWYFGEDSFTWKANDGGVPPEGGDSEIATTTIEISLPAIAQVYSFPLDSDPGWTTESQWAFGQPTGGGTHRLDPTSGHTGPYVYGFNLNGDYANNMPAYYLTTTAIDCSQVVSGELRFWRWLGVERAPFDHATVEVSNDGQNWTLLWSNPDDWPVSDTQWQQMTFDISDVADHQPTLFVRWGMGPTDDTITYPGWNVDDLEIWGVVTTPPCAGDLDGDWDIDLADLALLLANYGMSGAQYSDGDLDGDGDVDLADLSGLLAAYGAACP